MRLLNDPMMHLAIVFVVMMALSAVGWRLTQKTTAPTCPDCLGSNLSKDGTCWDCAAQSYR